LEAKHKAENTLYKKSMISTGLKKFHFIVITLTGCLMLFLGGYIYYSFENETIHTNYEQELKTIAKLKVNLLSQWYREKSSESLVISQSPFFVPVMKEWLHNRENAPLTRDIRKRLRLLKDQFGFEDIFIASASGDLLLSTDQALGQLDSMTRSIIRAGFIDHEPATSDFYVCSSHHKTHFDFITMVRDGTSHTIFFLVVRDDPHKFLYPMLDAWPTGRKSAESLLLRRDGDSVLYLSDVRFQNNNELTIRKSLSATEIPAVRAALGYEGVFEGKNYAGVNVLAYIAPIPPTPWHLVAQIDQDEISADLMERTLTISIIVFALVALLLTGLALFYRSRQKAILQSLFIKEQELREYHEEFRTILYSIGDGVITIDLSGRIKQMNHAAEQLTGWNEKGAAGKPLDDVCIFLNDASRRVVENPISRVLREGIIGTLVNDTLLLSKVGKEIPIANSGAPIRNKIGEIEGAVLVLRDKTEEHEAQKLLLKSEEKYKIVADNTYSWEFWLSAEKTFIYNSPACKEMTGFEAELFIRDPSLMFKIIYEDDRPAFVQHWNEVHVKHRRCEFEFRLIHADGSIRWIQHVCNPVLNGNGVYLGSRGSNLDITKRKAGEVTLRESEQRYRTLFDKATDGIVILDTEGRLIDANESFANIHGYTTDEVRAMHLHDLDTEETAKRIHERLQQLVDGKTLHLEVEHYHKDGHIFPLDVVANPIELGGKKYILSFHRDISERKKAEEALRHSLSLVQATLESTTDGILVIDNMGTIAGYNNQFVTMWNIPRDVILAANDARTLSCIVSQLKYPDSFMEKVNYLYHNPAIDSFDTIEFTDGRTFERYSQPQRIDGVPIGRVWSFRDITERNSLEQQLIQSQKLEGIGTLAGGIAHDFNNLLSMILASAELLRMHISIKPELKKYVDGIIDASLRGSSISRQLLTFARPYETDLRPISVSHILSEVKDMLVHFLHKSIDVRLVGADDDGMIMGDPGQIHQAILNLAINASDAMLNNGTLTIKKFTVEPTVIRQKFGQLCRHSYVAVSVSDTGIGIEAAVIEKIFDPFFSTKEKGKGTGLGLSIVHGIIKNHSGFVDVNSIPNQGTTFTIYFPLISDVVKEPQTIERSSAAQKNETILVVDDETVIREMLTEYLSESGYRVLKAANGNEALELFQQHRESIKVVITDLGMPQMGGEELFRHIRTIDETVNVIACSGYLDGTTKKELQQLGFREILTKPYKFQEILAAIQAV
jgi:two-component system, cell cycle sensor histidine kinase and response regulator CckA